MPYNNLGGICSHFTSAELLYLVPRVSVRERNETSEPQGLLINLAKVCFTILSFEKCLLSGYKTLPLCKILCEITTHTFRFLIWALCILK